MIFNGAALNGAALNGGRAGGVVTPMTLAVSVPSQSTVLRRVGKILSMVLSVVPQLQRAANFLKTLTATQALAPSRIISRGLTMVATSSAGAAVVRSIARTFLVVATMAGTARRQVGKPLSRNVGATPTLLRGLGQRLTATAVSLTANLVKGQAFLKALTAAATLTATLRRDYGKVLAATSALMGAIQRASVLVLAALAFTSPDVVRRVGKTLVRAVAMLPSASFGPGKILTASVVVGADLLRSIGKALLASQALAPVVRRLLSLTFGAQQLVHGATVKRLFVVMAPAVGLAASLLRPMLAVRQMLATSSLVPAVVRSLALRLSILVSPSATLARAATFPRALTASLTAGSALVRRISRQVLATIGAAASLAKVLAAVRSLQASAGAAGTLVRGISKGILALQVAAPSIAPALTARRTLQVTLSLATWLNRIFPVLLVRAVGGSAAVVRQIRLSIAGQIPALPSLTRGISLTLAALQALSLPEWMVRKIVPRTLSTSTTAMGSLALARGKAMLVTLGLLPSLRRVISLPLVVTLFAVSRVGKAVSKALSLSVPLGPALQRSAHFARLLVAASGVSGVLSRARLAVVQLVAVQGTAGSLVKRIGKVLGAEAAARPVLNRGLAIRLTAGLLLGATAQALKAVRNVIDIARRVFAPSRRRTWRA